MEGGKKREQKKTFGFGHSLNWNPLFDNNREERKTSNIK